MRKPSFSGGGNSGSTGCSIFLLFIIFMPVIGFFTDILIWIFDNIILVLIISFICISLLALILLSRNYEEKEEEEI